HPPHGRRPKEKLQRKAGAAREPLNSYASGPWLATAANHHPGSSPHIAQRRTCVAERLERRGFVVFRVQVRRVKRTLFINSLVGPKAALRLVRGEIGDDGLAGNRSLSLGNERPRASGQVDIHPRAEANHADALASCDRCTLAYETNNSPRHQTRDLHHADAAPVAGDEEAISLVALARLVKVCADESAGTIDHALDFS